MQGQSLLAKNLALHRWCRAFLFHCELKMCFSDAIYCIYGSSIIVQNMATKQATIDYLLDQLRDIKDVRARKMFGEYALYSQDKVVALVCDDELFVKITEPGKKFVGKKYMEGYPYPGAKAAMHINGSLLEDIKFITELIRLTATVLPVPRPKNK